MYSVWWALGVWWALVSCWFIAHILLLRFVPIVRWGTLWVIIMTIIVPFGWYDGYSDLLKFILWYCVMLAVVSLVMWLFNDETISDKLDKIHKEVK